MIWHTHSIYIPNDPQAQRRHSIALLTWSKQNWNCLGIYNMNLTRLFKDGEKELPYLRDLFESSCQNAKGNPDSIIVFTNSDICVASNCTQRIEAHLNDGRDACYAFRRDFQRLDGPIPDDQIATGFDYCGADLFAFRVKWWREHGAKFPDMVLGREAWDACMRVLMEATNPKKPLSLPNLIYHERHPNGWEAPNVRYKIPGQIHNLRLAYSWLPKFGQNPAWFGVRKV